MSDSNFLAIDEGRLDQEWLEQPTLYHKHAVALADARLEQDQAKINLDLVEAELIAKIRKAPKVYGLDDEKVSEKAIAAVVPNQSDFKKAQRMLLDAKHSVDVAQAAVTALEHRKRALTMLVELHGRDYFSAPALPKGKPDRERLKEVEKRGVRRMGKRNEDDDREDNDD